MYIKITFGRISRKCLRNFLLVEVDHNSPFIGEQSQSNARIISADRQGIDSLNDEVCDALPVVTRFGVTVKRRVLITDTTGLVHDERQVNHRRRTILYRVKELMHFTKCI